jgi:hypothetical protein
MPTLFHRLLVGAARVRARILLGEFRRKTRRVARVQEAVLLDKVRRNADSKFGREHRFQLIHDVASFRRRLPVAGYEAFAPYIDRVRLGDVSAMFGGGQRVRMFSRTSGTTGAPKHIPITDAYLREYRRTWLMWGYAALRDHPGLLDGRIFSLVGDWDEFRTPAGIPCGSVSGLVRASQPRVARARYCLPDCVMRISDVRAKYYVAMRLALADPCVSFAAVANPATLIGAARLAAEHQHELVRDIADGTLKAPGPVPAAVRAALEGRLRRKAPARARQLDRLIARRGRLLPRDYWPDLALIGNWTGGTMGAYLRHYPALFGEAPVRDLGLVASEGRMTIPMEDGRPAGALDITSHFYEFIPEGELEADRPTVLLAHELSEGASYYLLLTTSSGLYRYHISDVVRCVGHWGEAPVLEFLNKGAHCCNLTGEKVTEFQVAEAVRRGLEDLDAGIGEYTLAPCWDEPPYYALLIEDGDLPGEAAAALARQVDGYLAALNLEYRSRRDTRRLGPVRLRLLRAGAWWRFDEERRRQAGGSAEQYKHPCLVTDLTFAERLTAAGNPLATSPAAVSA